MNISVVIPTYNRGEQLSEIVDCLLKSNTDGIENIEIIIVDDGSKIPVKDVVEPIKVNPPFTIKYIFQQNAGPAKARNNGFQQAMGEIVLFIDDDILVTPSLIGEHLSGHRKFAESVIFGKSPFVEPSKFTPAYRYLTFLTDPSKDESDFVKVNYVASGNLSVKRKMFSPIGVYRQDLQVPAAEEFELEHRLRMFDIPIYRANEAIGWHLQPPTIEDKCKQEYKYGVGASEVWQKIPEIINNEHISQFVKLNDFIDWEHDSFSHKLKKTAKSVFAFDFFRKSILSFTKLLEIVLPIDFILFKFYRFLCGIYLFAGFREGIKKYGELKKPKNS